MKKKKVAILVALAKSIMQSVGLIPSWDDLVEELLVYAFLYGFSII